MRRKKELTEREKYTKAHKKEMLEYFKSEWYYNRDIVFMYQRYVEPDHSKFVKESFFD